MAVCSMLHQLATHPLEQQRIQEELKKVLPDPNMPLTIQLLDQMLYLNASIREVFFREEDNGRTLMEDTVIGDY